MEQAGIVMLNLSDLRPMENYRKSMDEKKMSELTESVRTKGVIQPIMVRPNPSTRSGQAGYEIIFGQRRWIAAGRAGLKQVPGMIRKVTDVEALELQVIENSQREDPNPMEEGLGFKKLLETGKHTNETLAAKLDHSVDYVLGRIKLVSLPKWAQDKMLSGEIGIGHALVLTRLKNDGDMKRLAETIVEDSMSVKNAERELRQFSTEMVAAIFDKTGCTTCQSRTRNQSELFPGAAKEKDQCLDRSCFYTKTKAFWTSYAADVKASGVMVLLTEKAVEKYTSGDKKATSRRLSLEKGDHSGETPKNRAQCQKCKENRAFFVLEKKMWDGQKKIETGWFCLDKKCLEKMNRMPSSGASRSGAAASKPVRNTAVHARAVRDRFIYAAMPAKFESSATLQKRLAIYHLLGRFSQLHGSVMEGDAVSSEEIRSELMAEFVPGREVDEVAQYGFGDDAYAIVAEIPEKDLDAAMTKIIKASLRHTGAEVLLRMAREAGISMVRDFKADEAYLNSMTKDDLVSFAKVLNIHGLKLDGEMKKTAMIEEILKHDLTGKLPNDVAEECELPTLDELCPKVKPKLCPKEKKAKVKK